MREKLYVVRRGSYIKHLAHPHRRDKIMAVSPSQKMCKKWIMEHKNGEKYYIDIFRGGIRDNVYIREVKRFN